MLKVVRRFVILAVIGWVAYVVVAASWTYSAAGDAVDKALFDAASRYRTPLRTGTFTESMLADVRESVAREAGRSGFAVDATDVAVSASALGLSASIRYAYPLITHRGTGILAIPLSLERSKLEGFPG
jgi:hypothetical protein